MGNCFNKHGGKGGLETKSVKYQIHSGDESANMLDDLTHLDPEMQALVKPMPTKPTND